MCALQLVIHKSGSSGSNEVIKTLGDILPGSSLALITKQPTGDGDWKFGYITARSTLGMTGISITWVKNEHWTPWSTCKKANETVYCGNGTQSHQKIINSVFTETNVTKACNTQACPNHHALVLYNPEEPSSTGMTPTYGLLEIYMSSKSNFGTVCDDNFDAVAGGLACQQLNLGEYVSHTRYDKSLLNRNVFFGKIFLLVLYPIC